MSEGGIILGFAVRGEVRLSWDAKGEGGGSFSIFSVGAGVDLLSIDPMTKNIYLLFVLQISSVFPKFVEMFL